jgi:hypothetical protein
LKIDDDGGCDLCSDHGLGLSVIICDPGMMRCKYMASGKSLLEARAKPELSWQLGV